MVLEALGIIFGSLTAITLGALKFAEVIDRRKRAEDKADLKLEEENALAEGLASKPLRIYPFADQGYSNSSRCLICNAPTMSRAEKIYQGPLAQISCPNPLKCLARDVPDHLHCHCMSCNAYYFMHPKGTPSNE